MSRIEFLLQAMVASCCHAMILMALAARTVWLPPAVWIFFAGFFAGVGAGCFLALVAGEGEDQDPEE
jgi:hypothetical protein